MTFNKLTRTLGSVLLGLGVAGLVATALAADKKPKIAYVTNGIDPFWNVAAAGVRQAAREFNVDTEVLMPPNGIVDQKRMIETLLVRGVDGIAISPIDAKNQVDFINQAASQTKIITHDSDAPDSKRNGKASRFIHRIRRDVRRLVAEWAGSYQYTIDRVIEDMIARAAELQLRLKYPLDRTKLDFTMLVTVQTMNYLHSGRHRVAL